MGEIIEVEPYANDVQRFYFEELKWCGCGSPAETLGFMRGVLSTMKARSDASRAEGWGVPYADSAWAKGTKALDEMLGDGALGLSYLYVLDAHGLTEHGGSVGGSWLTEKGEKVLALLDCDLEAAMDDDNYPPVKDPQ